MNTIMDGPAGGGGGGGGGNSLVSPPLDPPLFEAIAVIADLVCSNNDNDAQEPR